MKVRHLVLGAALAAGMALAGVAPVVTQAKMTQRYVVASGGSNNPTCSQADPCATIGEAVAAAQPGDTINVAAGTYAEQVVVDKSVTIRGAGKGQTTIKAPATFTLDSFGATSIVEIGNGATVAMTRLTVAGPAAAADSCAADARTLSYGIFVVQNATLNLDDAAVNDIFNGATLDGPLGGCQIGVAIRVGSNALGTFGHATINNSSVDRYQKGGIVIDGSGSSSDIALSQISDAPESTIASNGIQISRGATARVESNVVSGNECNLAVVCGPDPLSNETQSDGILLYQAGATTVRFNAVRNNDKGIEVVDGVSGDQIMLNYINDGRSAGISVFQGSGLHITGNTVLRGGQYGILLGSDSSGVVDSVITANSAFGDTTYDLYADANSIANTFGGNLCGTAYPSKTVWGCH